MNERSATTTAGILMTTLDSKLVLSQLANRRLTYESLIRSGKEEETASRN